MSKGFESSETEVSPERQPRQDGPARGVGERREGGAERVVGRDGRHVIYPAVN